MMTHAKTSLRRRDLSSRTFPFFYEAIFSLLRRPNNRSQQKLM